MTQIILSIAALIIVVINLVLILLLNHRINILATSIQLTLDKYILVVRSLGLAEGNVQGIAQQVETQKQIDKHISAEEGEQEITGIVKGKIKKIR